MACPICTKRGALLYFGGLVIILLSTVNILPTIYPTWIGLGLILSAFVIPNIIKEKTCNDGTCSSTNQK